MTNYFKEYSESCPICGKELEDMKMDENSVEFSYICGHKAHLVAIKETISHTMEISIETYMEKDLNFLYTQLANLKEPKKLHALTASVIDFVKRGKERFAEFQQELHQKICIDFEMCNKLRFMKKLTPVNQAGLLAQIIASATLTVVPWYIPTGLLASIYVKEGLSKMCQCD